MRSWRSGGSSRVDTEMSGSVLLDTCAVIWLMMEPARLSIRARTVIEDGLTDVLVSAVSVFEIAVKHKSGKLSLPEATDQAIPSLLATYYLTPQAFDVHAAYRYGLLPGHHRDPFDRMLICQALAHDLPIVTPDPAFKAYPVRVIW